MTDRCEPPPELRDKGGWHWLHSATKRPEPWIWLPDAQCWSDFDYRDLPDGAEIAARGHRYHAPIPDPPAKPYRWNEEA